MSYKRIRGAVYNLAHSFVSLMNYVDDGYVVDDIDSQLRQQAGEVSINFLTGAVDPPAAATPRIRKSIEHYRSGLADHLRSEHVEPERVGEVILRLRLTATGYDHVVEVTDDRGVHHAVPVRLSA